MDQNIPKKGRTYKHYDYFEHGQLRHKYVIKGKKVRHWYYDQFGNECNDFDETYDECD